LFPIIFRIEISLRNKIDFFTASADGGKAGKAGKAEQEFFHLLKTIFQTFYEGLRGLGTRQEHFHSPETGIIFIGPYSLERENLLYTATAGSNFELEDHLGDSTGSIFATDFSQGYFHDRTFLAHRHSSGRQHLAETLGQYGPDII